MYQYKNLVVSMWVRPRRRAGSDGSGCSFIEIVRHAMRTARKQLVKNKRFKASQGKPKHWSACVSPLVVACGVFVGGVRARMCVCVCVRARAPVWCACACTHVCGVRARMRVRVCVRARTHTRTRMRARTPHTCVHAHAHHTGARARTHTHTHMRARTPPTNTPHATTRGETHADQCFGLPWLALNLLFLTSCLRAVRIACRTISMKEQPLPSLPALLLGRTHMETTRFLY